MDRQSSEKFCGSKNFIAAMSSSNEGVTSRRFLHISKYPHGKQDKSRFFLSFKNFPPKNKNLEIFIQRLLNSIVREELAQEIDNDIELHEIIMREILDNWDEWQNEEYERSMESMMETEHEEVFCPCCEKNLLTLNENIISCVCGLRLYYSKSLSEFYAKVQNSLCFHEQQRNCLEKLHFFAEPKIGFNVLALNALCPSCDYYTPILELI